MKHRSIPFKIGVVLCGFFMVCAALIAVGAYGINEGEKTVEAVVAHQVQTLYLGSKAQGLITRIHQLQYEIYAATDSSLRQDLRNTQLNKYSELTSAMTTLKETLDEGDLALYNEINDKLPTYMDLSKAAFDLTDASKLSEAQSFIVTNMNPIFDKIEKKFTDFVAQQNKDMATAAGELHSVATRMLWTLILVGIVGTISIFTIALLFVRSAIAAPVGRITKVMEAIAGGEATIEVPYLDQRNEIGAMAKAVQVFKENARRLLATQDEATKARQTAEQERSANEATRAAIQHQQKAVVAAIAQGLDRLSKGDLTGRINEAFAAEYEKLRADFNATAVSLQDALGAISQATSGISNGSDQIAHASDDLARRTEQQAASLEETAASLNLITETVKAMAANAGQAAAVVVSTRTSAESSGAIVEEAVGAMSRIQDSSRQIGNIIGVIDEIAFQTNLLALNAGVEAARAGEAGRGFAVVASEVRALAQRSAEAAKEIKGLITASTTQVESGVLLVGKTGLALKDIMDKVAEMEHLVHDISTASKEQATSIAEINIAVKQMDQVVQQNAAMVEESTAAAHALKGETQGLSSMVGRFQIGERKLEVVRPHEATRKVAPPAARPSPSRPMLKPTQSAVAIADDWQEF